MGALVGADVDRAERAEAEFWATHARNVATSDETRDTGALAVAGGYALCLQGTFLTYGLAVGSARPLRPDDLRIVDEFYGARDLPSRLELHPMVAHRDTELLALAGYTPELSLTVFEREIQPDELTPPKLSVEMVGGRRSEWIETVTEGFLDTTAVAEHGRLRQATIACAAAANSLFLARIDGRAVGGAALGVTGDAALFFSASVLPSARRRGVHRALIEARLAAASSRGATYAFLKATLPSASAASTQSAGFRATYERHRMRKG